MMHLCFKTRHLTRIKKRIHKSYPPNKRQTKYYKKITVYIGRILGTFSTYNKSSIVLNTAGTLFTTALEDADTLEIKLKY